MRTYTISMYKVHDLDLITYMMSYEFNIAHAAYCALKAFAKHDLFIIKTPPRAPVTIQMDDIKHVYRKTMTLYEDRDPEVIELLDMIKNGYKNNFIKNILRQYLCIPLTPSFLRNPQDMDVFSEYFHIFREGKREAAAGLKKGRSKDRKAREKKEKDLDQSFIKELEKYAQQIGGDVTDPKVQLEFIRLNMNQKTEQLSAADEKTQQSSILNESAESSDFTETKISHEQDDGAKSDSHNKDDQWAADVTPNEESVSPTEPPKTEQSSASEKEKKEIETQKDHQILTNTDENASSITAENEQLITESEEDSLTEMFVTLLTK